MEKGRSEAKLERYAQDRGLDRDRFRQWLSSGVMAARVPRDADDGRALGVRWTPTFVIGTRIVEGASSRPSLLNLCSRNWRAGALCPLNLKTRLPHRAEPDQRARLRVRARRSSRLIQSPAHPASSPAIRVASLRNSRVRVWLAVKRKLGSSSRYCAGRL